jgi:hypothetical protein
LRGFVVFFGGIRHYRELNPHFASRARSIRISTPA